MTPPTQRSLTPVALCIPDDEDTEILTLLEEHARTLKVVRRCADLVELEAAAEVGVAQIGVLSGSDPDCDTHYIERLHAAGMTVLLLQDYTPTGEAIGTQSLMDLGADLLAPAHEPAAIVRALLSLARSQPATPTPVTQAQQEKTQNLDTDMSKEGKENSQIPQQAPPPTGDAEEDAPLAAPDSTSADADPLHRTQASDGPANTDETPQATQEDAADTSSLSATDRAWLNSAHRHPQRGHVIAVWGTSGAPGRSTTAINLAAALQNQPGVPSLKVILIDADTYAPSIAHALGMGTDVSSLSAIARYVARGELHAEHIEQALQQSNDGMKVITGLSSPHRWREAAPSTLTQCIRAAREYADYVIVDVAAGSLDPLDEFGRFNVGRDEGIAAVLNAADVVMLVARSDAEGLHRLMYSLEWFHTHISGPQLRIVANMVCEERAGSRPAQAIAQALAPYLPGEDISLVAEDPHVLKAQLQGTSLHTTHPSSPAAQAFNELALSVIKLAARTEDPPLRTRSGARHGKQRRMRSPRMLSLANSIRKRRKAQTRDGA